MHFRGADGKARVNLFLSLDGTPILGIGPPSMPNLKIDGLKGKSEKVSSLIRTRVKYP